MSAMLELLGHLCRERVLVKVAASAAGAAGTQLPTPLQRQQRQVSGTARWPQALRGSSGGPSMSSAALPKAPYAQQRRRRPASPATTGTKLSPITARAGLLGGGLGTAIMSGAIQPPGGWSYRRRRLANALSRGAGLFNNLGNIGSAAYGAFMR